jgi:hypothetical protein
VATDRKFEPVDPDALTAHLQDMPEEELAMVRNKSEEEAVKRGIKSGPDFARMTDAELREYNRKNFGF